MLQRLHGGVLRPTGVAAVQNDVVGVGKVVLVGRHHQVGMIAPAVHAQRLGLERPAAERFGLGVVHRAADDGEHRRCRGPAPTVADDGVLPILAVDALELVGHVRERLIPADALPFVAAAQLAMGVLAAAGLPVLALHGVLQAVAVVHLLAQRAPAQAAALLRAIPAILAAVVGFLAHHHAVYHVAHVVAHLVAVLMAMDGHPLACPACDLGIACHLVVAIRFRLRGGVSLRRADGLIGGHSCNGPGACAQKAATTHALIQHRHGFAPLVSLLPSETDYASVRSRLKLPIMYVVPCLQGIGRGRKGC